MSRMDHLALALGCEPNTTPPKELSTPMGLGLLFVIVCSSTVLVPLPTYALVAIVNLFRSL